MCFKVAFWFGLVWGKFLESSYRSETGVWFSRQEAVGGVIALLPSGPESEAELCSSFIHCQADSSLCWVCSQNSAHKTDWTQAVAEHLSAPSHWGKPVAIELPPPWSTGGANAKNSGVCGVDPKHQAELEQLLPSEWLRSRQSPLGR